MTQTLNLSNIDDLLKAELSRRTSLDKNVWSSRGRDSRDSVHSLFQYPAMMVPGVQRELINVVKESQPQIKYLFDPYVGAGTNLVAGMHNGLNVYGQDINPLAILVSRVKTGPFFCKELRICVSRTIEAAKADKSNEIAVDFPNCTKWFQQDVAVDLSKLKRAIENENALWARQFMWVILAETIRFTSNDRTTTFKLHARPLEEIKQRKVYPIQTFSSISAKALDDLEGYKCCLENAGYLNEHKYKGEVRVELGNTANDIPLVYENSPLFDLLVTSPPYGDNKSTITYGQHSYLPLQWIKLSDIDSKVDASYLQSTFEIDSRSLGGKLSRQLQFQVEKLCCHSLSLQDTFIKLKDKPRDRLSRVASFYEDFIKALDKIISVLAPNAYLIWTIGNRHVGGIEIPNHRILIELLEKRNASLIIELDREILNKRMPHKNQITHMMAKEKILIFRKLI